MRRFRSERGGAGVGTLVALVIFLFIAYEAKQFGPPVMAQFQFEDAVVDATSLPAVVMPSRDRFVPDDRRGGREIR